MQKSGKIENSVKPKRLDLQGIRGLAIISVIGFHFYPSLFPNGYLGVDQFFVLSGFLMCMLLKRSETLPTSVLITTFYAKRFKRILPLYVLIIALSLIALYTVFPETAIETNQESASKALFFASNREKTDSENYFQMLAIAMDLFTHTWSLSVEVQFYFLVPLIFFLGSRLSHDIQIFYYAVIATFSYLFYSASSSTTAFNNVYARIWQFLLGMIVFLSTNSKQIKDYCLLVTDIELGDSCDEIKEDMNVSIMRENHSKFDRLLSSGKFLFLCSIYYFISYPKQFPSFIMRPFVTISTSCLIYVSENDKFLSNKILTYIGDISYSLYLIHWPIYCYWKLELDNNQAYLFVCLAISFLVSILIYETFEKWYLKFSFLSLASLSIFLYLFTLLLINKDFIQEKWDNKLSLRLDGVTDNLTLDDAAKLNYLWSVNDNRNPFSHCDNNVSKTKDSSRWCTHKGLSKNGKYKMAIIGNSWAGNHANIFHQECHSKANSILQGVARGCEPLYPSDDSKMCKNYLNVIEEKFKTYKPDVAFIFTRYFNVGKPSNFTDNLDKDPTYQTMKKQLNIYLKYIKNKLYILDAIPRVKGKYIKQIVPELKKHTKLEEIDKNLVSMVWFDIARLRYAKLFKDCGKKCERIDYVPEFFNNATDTFRFYDERGFSYFTSPNHLSPHGLEHVRHVYTEICQNL